MATAQEGEPREESHRAPAWRVEVYLGPTAAIRSAKIYRNGKGHAERHFASATATTLEDILGWARQHTPSDVNLAPENLFLARI